MADEVKSVIVVEDVINNSETGYIALVVKMRNTRGNATWDGPRKKYGISADTFKNQYNGDLDQFKAWVVAEHRQFTGIHVDLSNELEKLKGEEIG